MSDSPGQAGEMGKTSAGFSKHKLCAEPKQQVRVLHQTFNETLNGVTNCCQFVVVCRRHLPGHPSGMILLAELARSGHSV